jgi:hypothetical protein
MTHIVDLDELIETQTDYVDVIKSYNLPGDAAELAIAEKDLATLVDLKERVMVTTINSSNFQPAPVIPDGWHLSIIEIHKGGGYRCALYHDDLNYVDAVGPTWQEALAAAIAQAEVSR